MARGNNLPAKVHKAGERTELSLRFVWNCGDGNSITTKHIDLAKALSMVNRRAYRQGLYYYVASIEFSNGSEAYCQVNTLPDTYMTKLSWSRGFKIWSKMNRLAAADGHAYPKYHDFKTQLKNGVTIIDPVWGSIASDGGGGSPALPDPYTADDWVTSVFVTDDPPGNDPQVVDEFTSHMLGPHIGSAGSWTSIGLIRSLQDTWAYQPAEGIPSHTGDADTDPLGNMFDAGDAHDDVRLNLDQDNDEPPYDHDNMTGASSVEETVIKAIMRTSAGAGAISRAPGFCAPLGLLEVNVSDFGASTDIGLVELRINLVPGTYNGVHAERIL